MSDLITRLKAATEGSRELDVGIWCAIYPEWEPVPDVDETGYVRLAIPLRDQRMTQRAPHYTTSLDAALLLLPEGWRITWFGECPDGTWFCDLIERNGPNVVDRIWVTTAALALCIAAMEARAA